MKEKPVIKAHLAAMSLLASALWSAPNAWANHILPPNKVPPMVMYKAETEAAAQCLVRDVHLIEGSWGETVHGDAHFTRVSHNADKYKMVWEIAFYVGVREGRFPGIDIKKIDACMEEFDIQHGTNPGDR